MQRHYYGYIVDWAQQPGFVHKDGLRSASVSTWDHRYGDMRLRLRYVADGAPVSTCGGHALESAGRLKGEFVFRPPHDSIGTITRFSPKASLVRGDGTCAAANIPQPRFTGGTPCPARTMVATGETSPRHRLGLIARRDPGSDQATINVYSSNAKAPPYVWHTIDATVPADHVQIASDFSSIEIRGGRGTYLHGVANATQTGPPTPWVAPAGCPSSGGAAMQAPEGNFSGDLQPNFFLGEGDSVASAPVAATAWLDISG